MKKGIIIIILCLFMTTSAEARGVATLYENGMDHFASGNNMFAFMAFREILRDHSSSEYADDAQFRIGEYYYREKSFSRAEKAFDQFLVKYPRSPFRKLAMRYIRKINPKRRFSRSLRPTRLGGIRTRKALRDYVEYAQTPTSKGLLRVDAEVLPFFEKSINEDGLMNASRIGSPKRKIEDVPRKRVTKKNWRDIITFKSDYGQREPRTIGIETSSSRPRHRMLNFDPTFGLEGLRDIKLIPEGIGPKGPRRMLIQHGSSDKKPPFRMIRSDSKSGEFEHTMMPPKTDASSLQHMMIPCKAGSASLDHKMMSYVAGAMEPMHRIITFDSSEGEPRHRILTIVKVPVIARRTMLPPDVTSRAKRTMIISDESYNQVAKHKIISLDLDDSDRRDAFSTDKEGMSWEDKLKKIVMMKSNDKLGASAGFGYLGGRVAYDYARHTSELEFPMHNWVYGFGLNAELTDYNLSLNTDLWIDSEGAAGVMKDKDWYSDGELYSYTESGAELDALIWDINLRYDFFKRQGEKDSERIGLALGHMYQELHYTMEDLYYVVDTIAPSYQGQTLYDNTRVIEYDVYYRLPYIGLAFDVQYDRWGLGGIIKCPFHPTAKDIDHHLLRNLIFYGEYDRGEEIYMGSAYGYVHVTDNWVLSTGADVLYLRMDGRTWDSTGLAAWEQHQNLDARQIVGWVKAAYEF